MPQRKPSDDPRGGPGDRAVHRGRQLRPSRAPGLRGDHAPRPRAPSRLGYEADPQRAGAGERAHRHDRAVLCGSLEDLWQQSLAVAPRPLPPGEGPLRADPRRRRRPRPGTHALARPAPRVDGLIVQPVDPAAAFWAEIAGERPAGHHRRRAEGDPHRRRGRLRQPERRDAGAGVPGGQGPPEGRGADLDPGRDPPTGPPTCLVTAEAARLGPDGDRARPARRTSARRPRPPARCSRPGRARCSASPTRSPTACSSRQRAGPSRLRRATSRS